MSKMQFDLIIHLQSYNFTKKLLNTSGAWILLLPTVTSQALILEPMSVKPVLLFLASSVAPEGLRPFF